MAEIMSDRASGARRLVQEYGNRLYQTAIRLCGNRAEAEDYVFRTLERAFSKIGTYRSSSSFFTWLYAILVNLIRTDARRKAANALDFPGELPEQADPRPEPASELAAREEADAVRASIGRLPQHLREVVVFRYWENLTVPEIASVLSVPEGTVKSRLHQAKILIRGIVSRTICVHPASNPHERS